MLTCYDIADYLLALQDEDCGDTIWNLKLQKLVYYAQGFHLALYNKPLFEECIEAWTHGPVIPALYKKHKTHGSGALPIPKVDLTKYDSQTRELLDEVYDVYGQYTGWKLRNMTHEEPPWSDASLSNGIITNKAMKDYFTTLLM